MAGHSTVVTGAERSCRAMILGSIKAGHAMIGIDRDQDPPATLVADAKRAGPDRLKTHVVNLTDSRRADCAVLRLSAQRQPNNKLKQEPGLKTKGFAMQRILRTMLAAMLIAVFAGAGSDGLHAQGYPLRTVQIYLGFAPGTGADAIARFYSERMSVALKQPVVVLNKPGANGNIAAEAVARSKPDGYSILFGPSAAMSGGKFLYKDMPINPMTDFVTIAPLIELGFVLCVSTKSPFKNVQDLTDHLKSNPDRNYGTSNSMGIGSALLYLNAADVTARNVGYRATADALRDLDSGLLDFAMVDGTLAAPQVNEGKLRALGVTGMRRLPSLESVPTMREVGLPKVEIAGWWMVLAPKDTPADIVGKLNAIISDISRTEAAKTYFARLASIPLIATPEGTAKLLADDTKQWGVIAKLGNIEPQ